MAMTRIRSVTGIAAVVGLVLGGVGAVSKEILHSALLHLAGPLGLALATGLVLALRRDGYRTEPASRRRPHETATRVRRATAAAVLIGLTLCSTAPVSAGAPLEQLRSAVDRVLSIVEDPALKQAGRAEERRVAIRAVANEIFDFEEITRRALGPHWASGTPQQRGELVRLFGELLERSYLGRIESYSGERVAWLGDTADADLATVRTRIVTKGGTEIPVDYRMYRRDGRWLTYDVTIEGISLVGNYRAQFNKIIHTSSHAGLVAALRAKQ